MSTATTENKQKVGVTSIPAKKFADLSAKAIMKMVSQDSDVVLPLTFYNQVFAYVVPAEKAESALKSQQEMLSLLKDWKAVTPYIEAALEAGLPVRQVLDEIFKDDNAGSVAVDFAGLARLMSNTPIALVSNEDGSPIINADFKGAVHASDSEDEDYTPFDSL